MPIQTQSASVYNTVCKTRNFNSAENKAALQAVTATVYERCPDDKLHAARKQRREIRRDGGELSS